MKWWSKVTLWHPDSAWSFSLPSDNRCYRWTLLVVITKLTTLLCLCFRTSACHIRQVQPSLFFFSGFWIFDSLDIPSRHNPSHPVFEDSATLLFFCELLCSINWFWFPGSCLYIGTDTIHYNTLLWFEGLSFYPWATIGITLLYWYYLSQFRSSCHTSNPAIYMN